MFLVQTLTEPSRISMKLKASLPGDSLPQKSFPAHRLDPNTSDFSQCTRSIIITSHPRQPRPATCHGKMMRDGLALEFRLKNAVCHIDITVGIHSQTNLPMLEAYFRLVCSILDDIIRATQ